MTQMFHDQQEAINSRVPKNFRERKQTSNKTTRLGGGMIYEGRSRVQHAALLTDTLEFRSSDVTLPW